MNGPLPIPLILCQQSLLLIDRILPLVEGIFDTLYANAQVVEHGFCLELELHHLLALLIFELVDFWRLDDLKMEGLCSLHL